MKQILAFILLFSYSVAATGTNMQLHYCMGKLSEVNWNEKSEKKTCGKCGMEKSEQSADNGCCKDEHKLVKIDDDQKSATTNIDLVKLQQVEPEIQSSFGYDFNPNNTSLIKILQDSNAPPRSSTLALYKRYRVFRI